MSAYGSASGPGACIVCCARVAWAERCALCARCSLTLASSAALERRPFEPLSESVRGLPRAFRRLRRHCRSRAGMGARFAPPQCVRRASSGVALCAVELGGRRPDIVRHVHREQRSAFGVVKMFNVKEVVQTGRRTWSSRAAPSAGF